MTDEKPPAEWPAVGAGCLLAIVAGVVGLIAGIAVGSSMTAAFGQSLPVLMMLLGPLAAIAGLGVAVRRYRALVKGVWIGGALMLILVSACVGLILSFS